MPTPIRQQANVCNLVPRGAALTLFILGKDCSVAFHLEIVFPELWGPLSSSLTGSPSPGTLGCSFPLGLVCLLCGVLGRQLWEEVGSWVGELALHSTHHPESPSNCSLLRQDTLVKCPVGVSLQELIPIIERGGGDTKLAMEGGTKGGKNKTEQDTVPLKLVPVKVCGMGAGRE